MQSEVVELVEKENGDYSVRIQYFFRGFTLPGMKIAFPESMEYRLNYFTRTWNGDNLPVRRLEAEHGYGYRVDNGRELYKAKHVSILPWTFRWNSVLIDEYSFTPPEWEPGSKSDLDPGKYVEYILVTGALWSENIESIQVILRLRDNQCNRIQVLEDSYWGDCDEEGVWRAELKNTNPQKNIRLVVVEKKELH